MFFFNIDYTTQSDSDAFPGIEALIILRSAGF